MKISSTMDLGAVQERMGSEATRDEAAAMVEFLLHSDYTDTEQVPESEWLELCGLAAEGVARNAELAAARKAGLAGS